ncbi:hypothetical protein PCURB6_28170 [Paenibacillus curdlanolyticus]|nr:hypothetical protein PCURB6_28170 [Paenibacillus curdlanolyticus]
MPNLNTAKIRQALDAADYTDYEPTFDNLVSCFSDVAMLYNSDLLEFREGIANGSITADMMCEYLIRES